MQKNCLETTDVSNKNIFTIDCFKEGVEFGRMSTSSSDMQENLCLALPDFSRHLVRSRHAIQSGQFDQLEKQLSKYSNNGTLKNSVVYLGVQTDPFYPFEGKFDLSIKLLKLLEKFPMGKLVIQTRSPLVVIAISSLKAFGEQVVVSLGIETCSDAVSARYTPEFPCVSERISAASALKRFGIAVDIQVAPLLPYGKNIEDAGKFADILVRYAEHIYIKPLISNDINNCKKGISDLIAGAISSYHGSQWLNHDSDKYLVNKILELAPEKLEARSIFENIDKQLKIFG